MKKFAFILSFIFISPNAFGGYNANIKGKITDVLTYANSAHIYIRLENQPSSHPACEVDYFAIDASTPDAIRQQLLSRLLVAYASGEAVNIGYDSQGDCASGRIRVHRVG